MADRAHELTDELLKDLEERIRKEYEQAYKDVSAKLNKYLARFKTKDAQKRAMVEAGTMTQEAYAEWRHGQMCIGERWREMRDTLAQDLHNSNLIARQMITGEMPDVYALNHNYATFQVEHDSLVDTSYTLYNRKTVENLIRDNPKLLPDPKPGGKLAQRLAENKDLRWNQQHIDSAVTQGVLQGEPIPKIAKRLETVVGMDHRAAVRNARTMITSCQNKGRQDAYDDLKEEGVVIREKWISTLDRRTRDSHRWMHGTYKGEDGYYSNGLAYPGDPDGEPEEVYNCRCTEIAEVERIEIKTPKYSPKLGTQTFDEWQSEHGDISDMWWYKGG